MIKKYYSLGELLKDYREEHKLTQTGISDQLDVDLRTFQRWEQNETHLTEENVSDLVSKTSLPFQLVRNLNAIEPIPTFFDFDTQKYSLSSLSNEIPEAEWYKKWMDRTTKRMRAMDVDYDFDYLMNYMDIPLKYYNSLKSVIRESIKFLPELNQIISDELGFYAGFSLIIPITNDTRQLFKDRRLLSEELTLEHITDYKLNDSPILFEFKVSADSNDNIQYLVGHILTFLKKQDHLDYTYCGFNNRQDNYHLYGQFGFDEVSLEPEGAYGLRFFEGSLKKFFSN